MKIFKWRVIDAFLTFKDDGKILEILKTRSFIGEPMETIWENHEIVDIEKNVKKYDCSSLLSNPIVNKKAMNILHDILAPSVEFLPYTHDDADYFAVNVTNVLDCLDVESSEVQKNEKYNIITQVLRHEFYLSMIEDQVVFKIPQSRMTDVFITDIFVELVKSSGLTGFEFEEVWDSEAKPPSVTQPPVVMKEGPYSYKQAMDLVEAGKSVASGKWILQMVENELYLGSFEQNGAYSWMIPYYIPPILLELDWYVIDPVNMNR